MILHVHYGDGPRIGRLADDAEGRIWFQYDASWLRTGLNLSPISLPFVASPTQGVRNDTFRGLHGLFYDSLPDYWGGLLLDERLKQNGIDPESASPLVRLSYIGSRGMGALSYRPEADAMSPKVYEAVSLAQADREASLMLEGKPLEGSPEEVLALVQAGSSAGGAKPKVHAALKGDTVHIGSAIPEGFEAWIIKLSTVPAGHKDSKQSGRVEYAYSLMARAAGIDMPETRLFEIESKHGKRGLFGVKRFDRAGSERIHMHSLAGLLHRDFNAATCSYEDLARVAMELTGDTRSLNEVFRRMAFNVTVSNCDDHAKNFAFLLDPHGQWRLSPAFDLTRSPGIRAAGAHALTVGGNKNPTLHDLMAFADMLGMSTAEELLHAVLQAVDRWEEFAKAAGLRDALTHKMREHLQETAKNAALPAES